MELSNKYPEFTTMYEHVYNICQNMEKMMGMYSEELKILDQNTVRYMVDQMQGGDRQSERAVGQSEEAIGNEKQTTGAAGEGITEIAPYACRKRTK